MPGFIHDKLEIKFLILYITARVIEPIPFDTVWDLAMCDEGVDYFDFAECLSDLVRTEHLTLSADGLYAITDKGLRNSRICESSLPYSVRILCWTITGISTWYSHWKIIFFQCADVTIKIGRASCRERV